MGIGDYSIATLGSHSALQILHGAKQEGFKTIVVCAKGREEPYTMFPVADEIITVDSFKEFPEEELIKKNAIIIPHGSFIAYMGIEATKSMNAKYYGNKAILEWESDRNMEREWLKEKAGINMPLMFEKPEDIDRSVIVKFHGAQGGRGYFLARNTEDFNEKIKAHPGKEYAIQEYIIGVPIYIHYFYSPITKELEILSFDKRYESNVDSIGRISARDQIALDSVDPSYVVVGNVPIVIRESLLPKAIEMGKAVVEASKTIVGEQGLFGPFCLEGVLTPDQEFFIFEISARIVAGTNPFVDGSPYSYLKYDEPMSTGRRIARDIKQAIEQDRINEVIQ
ncbi:MAG: formate--phosphoribosylaminoimidazolecarboxamide ligase [Candidatus Woesearchaeota archaeon]|nr:formate--phosphoribosylaminoimidazolecarboxamide ligase [Candidatus Woesearchaeota archaeon]